MDWKQALEEGQQLTRDRHYDLAAEKYKEIIEGTEAEPKYHYWALKHFADLLGILYYKDYFRALDLYQRIINEYEGEDGLYEWCQIDMAKTYLLAGMDMFEGYDNIVSMLEPINDDMTEYLEKIKDKREDFFTEVAESIYKKRL